MRSSSTHCISFALIATAAIQLGGATDGQTPSFQELHRLVPTELAYPAGVASGDLDGDGIPDVFVAHGGDGIASRVLLGSASGAMRLEATPPLHPGYASGVALADVNLDGSLDAYVTTFDYETVSNPFTGWEMQQVGAQNQLLLGAGDGTFIDASFGLPQLDDLAVDVGLGDVDADGDPDALVAGAFDGTLFGSGGATSEVYLGTGNGFFLLGPPLTAAPYWTERVSVADVDGDGDADALFALGETLQHLLISTGGGLFTQVAGGWPQWIDDPSRFGFADLDGDGDLDAASSERVLRNDGTGVFTQVPGSIPLITAEGADIGFADFDTDGDADILIAVPYGAPNRLLENDGQGGFSDASSQLPSSAQQTEELAVDDFDGDGDADVYCANFNMDELWLGDGQGALGAPASVPDFGYTRDVVVADVNSDGIGDLLLACGDAPSKLFLGQGGGGLIDASANLPDFGDATLGIAAGDIDGDGDQDLLLANSKTGGKINRLYLGDGAGGFTDLPGGAPFPEHYSSAAELADFDGDGDLDAAVASEAYAESHLAYENVGGSFAVKLPGFSAPPATSAYEVEVADLNGDGFPDVFFPAYPNNQTFQNDGSGGFNLSATPLNGPNSNTADVADIDADGDQDVVLGPPLLFVNDGFGTFTDASSQLSIAPGSYGVPHLGDLDRDGDQDLALVGGSLAGGLPDQASRLLLNDGAGNFSEVPGAFVADIMGYVTGSTLADLDQDGDPDLLVAYNQSLLFGATASSPGLRILTNLHRQLAHVGVAGSGKTFDFEVRGPASGTWLLAWSLSPGQLPLPPFGMLWIDPFGLVLSKSGALDSNGRHSFQITVAANPVWIGTTLYWQSLIGAPLELSNREASLIVGY